MYTFLFFLFNTKHVTNFRLIVIWRLVLHLLKKCIRYVDPFQICNHGWLVCHEFQDSIILLWYLTRIWDHKRLASNSRDFSKLVYCKLIHSCGKKCTRVIDPWEPCKGPFGSRPGAKTGWNSLGHGLSCLVLGASHGLVQTLVMVGASVYTVYTKLWPWLEHQRRWGDGNFVVWRLLCVSHKC